MRTIETQVYKFNELSEEAQQKAIERCPDSAIIDIKENGPSWNELKTEQLKVCALYAYYLFNFWEVGKQTKEDEGRLFAAHHACSLFDVPSETLFQIEAGYIKGLTNLNRLSGGVYKQDYEFVKY